MSIFLLRSYLAKFAEKKNQNFFASLSKSNTVWDYYFHYTAIGGAGKEIRLYNQKPLIMEVEKERLNKFIGNHSYGAIGVTEGIAAVANTALSGAVYVIIGLRALYGVFGIGDVVQYVGAVTQLAGHLTNVVVSISILKISVPHLEQLYAFLDLPDQKYKGSLPVEKRVDNEYEIEFRNVSFKYPGSTRYALRNLNLKFRIGQRLAVVGMNGSGKTTMIKLLCRLYDPTEGEITLNGIDIKKFRYHEYIGIFSVVFQDFSLFGFPLGQNIASSVDIDEAKATECLQKSGAQKMSLDTFLYKGFDENGVEISGGEAQKIALARALYKDAPFIVLDEPTAALDPIAEFEIYSKFNEIIGGKTAVYISHRLSSCRFCDDIAVFHDGQLVQRGRHDDLIADVDGKYFELWGAQAQYYSEVS